MGLNYFYEKKYANAGNQIQILNEINRLTQSPLVN